jgi:uncharacterized tellurite resistance protein B-like protein
MYLWHSPRVGLRRVLGLGDQDAVARPPRNPARDPDLETDTIRRIANELGQVDPAQRRYIAGLAYVLGRAANADLTITDEETREMEQIVREIGGLPDAQAVLAVEIAKHQAELYGGTDDYVVTRDFAARATPEQRRAAVAACFAVVATDHEITAEEYAELTEIARELDLGKNELNEIRREYADQLTAIQLMRGRQP